jgi:hypothetical protein
MTETRTCQGCDTELPAQTRGRPRLWCTDRCRKRTLYSRQCVDCGAPCNTDGAVRDAATRCGECSRAHQSAEAVWTRETVLDAGRRWQAMVGRQVMTTDWNPAQIRHPERRAMLKQLRQATGPWPPAATVLRVFGSWNAFIRTLDGVPRRSGAHPGRNARTEELRGLVDRLAA